MSLLLGVSIELREVMRRSMISIHASGRGITMSPTRQDAIIKPRLLSGGHALGLPGICTMVRTEV